MRVVTKFSLITCCPEKVKTLTSPFPIGAPCPSGYNTGDPLLDTKYCFTLRSTPFASVTPAFAGSCIVVQGLDGGAPAGFEHSSPLRAAGEGTKFTLTMPLDCRIPSKSAKKKVRFLMMGPPMAPPNWFRLKGDLCPASKKFAASSLLLRRN